MELHRSGYIAQIAAYIRNKSYEKAYEMAKEFAEKFPDEMIAHFFLSESAFWLSKYEEAALEGSKAFNKSATNEDMLASAIITGSAYYELQQYAKGFGLLKLMERRRTNESLERLLFLFSMALNDHSEAASHLNELYGLNQKAAEELAIRYLKG